jgi:hypothetical protein
MPMERSTSRHSSSVGSIGLSAFRAAVVAWSSCRSASVAAGPCCSSTATATASSARTSLGTWSVGRAVPARQHLLPNTGRPADERVSPVPHARLDGMGTARSFVGEAAGLGSHLDDPQSPRLVQPMGCAPRLASAPVGSNAEAPEGLNEDWAVACFVGNFADDFASVLAREATSRSGVPLVEAPRGRPPSPWLRPAPEANARCGSVGGHPGEAAQPRTGGPVLGRATVLRPWPAGALLQRTTEFPACRSRRPRHRRSPGSGILSGIARCRRLGVLPIEVVDRR